MDNIQDKPIKKLRELAEPVPRGRLVPITTVLQAIFDLSNGRASIPELVNALHKCYDLDQMMIYSGSGYGLANPIDGNPFDEFGGFNERADICSELFNSHYWRDDSKNIFCRGIEYRHDEILMDRKDGLKLAGNLWDFFEPDQTFDIDEFIEIRDALLKSPPQAEAPDRSRGQDKQSESPAYLDTSHPRYAPKLAAVINAWLAFEAIPGKTVRQSIERWLRANAGQYGLIKEDGTPNESAIVELSKVANWDTNGGPPKTPG